MKKKYAWSVRYDRYQMLFFGIIAILILWVKVIWGDQHLQEWENFNKYIIPTKAKSKGDFKVCQICQNSLLWKT